MYCIEDLQYIFWSVERIITLVSQAKLIFKQLCMKKYDWDTDIDHDAMEWVFKELVNLKARIREQFLTEHFIKTVSGAFHETWNAYMKYFCLSI